jgi:hypothetical protein
MIALLLLIVYVIPSVLIGFFVGRWWTPLLTVGATLLILTFFGGECGDSGCTFGTVVVVVTVLVSTVAGVGLRRARDQ